MTQQAIALNIVASGNLETISNFLGNSSKPARDFLLVVPKTVNWVLRDATRNSDIAENKSGVYPIVEHYSYGFDIVDAEGDQVEINDSTELGETGFLLVDGIAGEPKDAEPAEQVETVTLPPDVTKLSSDDLFTVVANYDNIHTAAVAELNSRISAVKDKLEE